VGVGKAPTEKRVGGGRENEWGGVIVEELDCKCGRVGSKGEIEVTERRSPTKIYGGRFK